MYLTKGFLLVIQFLYPAFLFALFALAIPIIIHLFNFRRYKTIYFTNVRFLKEIKQETQSRSKIRHLLVLLTRMLALTFLVLAFAQPFLPVAGNKKPLAGENSVSIYIDNSFSMDATNTKGTLLDEAKRRAKEILSSYNPSDRFQLLTNDFEGKHQRLLNKDVFLQELEQVKISPAVKSIDEVLSRQSDLLNSSKIKNKTAFILSDFQKSFINSEVLKTDSSISLRFISLMPQDRNNLYVDSCWFYAPVRQLDQTEVLNIRIKNNSDKPLENNPIKLYINGKERAPSNYDIDANNKREITFSFLISEPGLFNAYVEITDYPVTFDDKFYFSFEVKKNIPVMLISGSNKDNVKDPEESKGYFSSLFGKDSLFAFSTEEENNISYSRFSENSLLIMDGLRSIPSGLAQELKRYIELGGSIFVFPSSKADLPSYSGFLQSLNIPPFERFDTSLTKIDNIDYSHPLYADIFEKKSTDIDLPVVKGYYQSIKNSRSNQEVLLKIRNGESFLSSYSLGKGKVYICASPLQSAFGNFSRHALFVPTMYKAAILSQFTDKLYYTIGKNETIETSFAGMGQKDNTFKIRAAKGEYELIPEQKTLQSTVFISTGNSRLDAGNYEVIYGDKTLKPISFNYDRKESDMSYFSLAELEKIIAKNSHLNMSLIDAGEKSISYIIKEESQGKKLWKLCIILTLVFFASEIVLLRLFK